MVNGSAATTVAIVSVADRVRCSRIANRERVDLRRGRH